MTARAPALYNLEEKAAVPQTQWIPSEIFSSHSATLTNIKCIKDMATLVTGVEDIDSQNILWQFKRDQVLEPPQGTTLRTQNGSRLWFPVTLRDFHGSTTMYITEPAALNCSKQTDAASFEWGTQRRKTMLPHCIISENHAKKSGGFQCECLRRGLRGAAVRFGTDNFCFGFVKVALAKVPERQR